MILVCFLKHSSIENICASNILRLQSKHVRRKIPVMMKIRICIPIHIFSSICLIFPISSTNVVNESSSFIRTDGLFNYFKGLSDDFTTILLRQAFVAASINRNLFNIEETISEGCQRTAKAVVEMYEKLLIVVEMDKIIERSTQKSVSTLKNSIFPLNPVEFICRSVDAYIQTFLVLSPELEYWKKVAHISKTTKPPFYFKIPKSPVQAIDIFFREVQDLQVARIVAIGAFVDHVQTKSGSDTKYVKTAKAIIALAKRADLNSAVQILYSKIINEVSEKAVVETRKESQKQKSSIKFILFFVNLYRKNTLESLDQAFTEDSMLKNEYKNMKDKF